MPGGSTEWWGDVDVPETRYAKTPDGLDIAYQTLGNGSPDVVQVSSYFSNLDHAWAEPSIARERRAIAELGRLICLDARGTGLSDRIAGDRLPTLEERIEDLSAVLDAADSDRAV